MLLVSTYLSNSPGKGVGLFAKEMIPEGTVWWVRNEDFDKVISDCELNSYTELSAVFIKTYGFHEQAGNWYLCIDNARFSNHSYAPNTLNNLNEKGQLVSCTASKNIYPGDEIFCNYQDICTASRAELGFEDAG
jgi:SET domain-containing protein